MVSDEKKYHTISNSFYDFKFINKVHSLDPIKIHESLINFVSNCTPIYL